MSSDAQAGISRPLVRVLIVDDSPTQRRLIFNCLRGDRRLVVVGQAADPSDARAMIKALNPAVLTLDIEMPGIGGLEFLRRIMRLRPMPVVMLSSYTATGSAAAIEALSQGAVDCVEKSPAAFQGGADGLAARVHAAAFAKVTAKPAKPPDAQTAAPFVWNGKLVVIGASTGGVDALERLLAAYPKNCPPTLIAQHMPAAYLGRFVTRLQNSVAPDVRLARAGRPILQGQVCFAPGGDTDLGVDSTGRLQLLPRSPGCAYCPSVAALFSSTLPMAPHVVAVMLSGMGRDGAAAMLALRRAGARCLAQDAESSVIFGMPGAALGLNAAERAVPIDQMAAEILALTTA